MSQHRSQQSQQSFSQGLSSQQGILSHFSQSSLDETIIANDQVKTKRSRFWNFRAYPIEECHFPIAHV